MTSQHFLTRRPTIGAPGTAGPGPRLSLPEDVLRRTCRRLWIVSVVFASIWASIAIAGNIAHGALGGSAIMDDLWPYPGNVVAALGFSTSAVMAFLVRRLGHKPQPSLDAGSGFLVVQCLLISILSQWTPAPITLRVSVVCVAILFYPAIVPNSPAKTLWTTLLAASMEPMAILLTYLRGAHPDIGTLYIIWNVLPNYLCAVLVVIPVKIIHGMGQQVKRARVLGSYRLEESLGKGGMGEVFRATHRMLARPAALKLIRPEIIGTNSPNARVVIERFRREAEAAASLRSPHTINLYDYGMAQDGTCFFAMELLDGLDLQTLVERFGPIEPARGVHLLRQVCDSLAEAHARGLVHRDIKPSNIYTCRLGLSVDFVKVLDFGLVMGVGEGKREVTLVTAPNSWIGTPAYMAPEVVWGDRVADHRVDIYALGCVAYWLLTGQVVFNPPNAIQLMYQHANATPVPPSEISEFEIPPALDQLILACLAKDPDDRPQSARELSHRLSTAVPGEDWTEEQAQEWWESHHPASDPHESPDRASRMLTKKVDVGSESQRTGASALASTTLTPAGTTTGP